MTLLLVATACAVRGDASRKGVLSGRGRASDKQCGGPGYKNRTVELRFLAVRALAVVCRAAPCGLAAGLSVSTTVECAIQREI